MSVNANFEFKWPIEVSCVFSVPSDDVWVVISTPEILEKTHPFCKRNPVYKWPGEGSKDTIEYYNGRIMHRDFYSWTKGLGYDLLIGREGGRKSKVTWRIQSVGENTSTLTIAIFPNILQNVSWLKAAFQYYTVVRPNLKKYLRSVLQGFEYYIRAGEPVSKNQFGSHKWFSP
jgi:hypothetical protein